MIIVSKVEETWLWIPRLMQNVVEAQKEACKFDDSYDIMESLEVIEDKLSVLDDILDETIVEAYNLNKGDNKYEGNL